MVVVVVVLAVGVVLVSAIASAMMKLYRAATPPQGRHRIRADGSFGFVTWMLGDSRRPNRVDENDDPRSPSA